jgi:RNA polymerase sigma factor (TIGR02999 family)
LTDDPRSAARDGDDETFLAIYDEMRIIARRRVHQYGADSLQATELANEAFARFGKKGHRWSNRSHLLRIAARTMRDVLIERARRKASLKRGGDWERVDWDSAARVAVDHPDELLMLDDALAALAEESPEAAEVVRLKFFAGLTSEEAASILEMSRRSVERRWAFARAWLFRALAED